MDAKATYLENQTLPGSVDQAWAWKQQAVHWVSPCVKGPPQESLDLWMPRPIILRGKNLPGSVDQTQAFHTTVISISHKPKSQGVLTYHKLPTSTQLWLMKCL